MKSCSRCGHQWAAAMVVCPADGTVLVDVVEAVGLASTGTGEIAPIAAITLPSPHELAPGTVVGEYQIEKLIGQGGMGMVYGARHPLIGKRSAIKVLHAAMSADGEGLTRFIQEAQAVNQIGHANIVDIFSFGTLPDGRAYFVMEWLQGETLKERIERGPLSITDTAAILLALVRALEAAHAVGIVHRDLKPENVFLVADDDAWRVKLLDFGIAKLVSNNATKSRTATGMTVGTPLYMSPEQVRGTGLDTHTDLYSLGIVGYEMLCGKTPFDSEASPIEVMHAHLAKPPRPPRNLRPDIPQDVEDLILALLAKRAEDRPALGRVRARLGSLAARSSPMAAQVGTVQLVSSPMAAQVETVQLVSSTVAAQADRVNDRGTGVATRRRVSMWIVGAVGGMGLLAWIAVSSGSRREAEPATRPAAREAHPSTTTSPAVTPMVPSSAPAEIPAPPPAPPAPPAPAIVDFVVDPVTASVALDGTPVLVDRGRVRLEVAPGMHTLTARAAGYRTIEQKLEAVAGASTQRTLKLVRERAGGDVAPPRRRDRTPPVQSPTGRTTDIDGVVDPFRRNQ